MKLRSRRGGSYIVEASLIYPIIAAVTVMLLAAAVYMYSLTAACSDLNRAVRREAGSASRTVFYNENDPMSRRMPQLSRSGGPLSGRAEAVMNRSYVWNLVFAVNDDNAYKAEACIISEADTLWKRQAVKHAAEALMEQ